MRLGIWISEKVSKQLDQFLKDEPGQLVDATTIDLFQSLQASALVWSLPGRTTNDLNTLGLCHPVQRSLHQQAVMG